jgi:hypothetical protein
MQLGTPAQQIRVLPMTQEGAIYTVLPEGCTSDDSSTCKDDRGSLYLINRTTTWEQQGLYGLSLIAETPLGYSGNGYYGHDTATLGWPGNDLPSVSSAIIAGIATKDFYMGGLPLNPWSVNFTSLTQTTPSLITLLKNESKIPSLTYGYTAGYYNNNPSVFGSLTLGGYDNNRFVSNNVSFTMGQDISRDLLVGIQSIETGSTKLLSQPIFAFVDSAVPTIWLPLDACQAFEKAFNLTWDTDAGLYLVTDSLHNQLLQDNPSVKFTIGPQTSGESVTIEMPYGAFDLNSEAPFSPDSGLYFPLKRADNATQYTLGRAFLQSAYVVADYETFSFSVYQATYPGSDTAVDLVTLPAKKAIGTGKSSSLSTGVIIGIAVGGGVAAILIIVGIVLLCLRQKKKRQQPKELAADHPIENIETHGKHQLDANGTQIHETDGRALRYEMDTQYKPAMKQQAPAELPVNEPAAWEAHSEEVTPRDTPSTTPGPQGASPSHYSQSPLSPDNYRRQPPPRRQYPYR